MISKLDKTIERIFMSLGSIGLVVLVHQTYNHLAEIQNQVGKFGGYGLLLASGSALALYGCYWVEGINKKREINELERIANIFD